MAPRGAKGDVAGMAFRPRSMVRVAPLDEEAPLEGAAPFCGIDCDASTSLFSWERNGFATRYAISIRCAGAGQAENGEEGVKFFGAGRGRTRQLCCRISSELPLTL